MEHRVPDKFLAEINHSNSGIRMIYWQALGMLKELGVLWLYMAFLQRQIWAYILKINHNFSNILTVTQCWFYSYTIGEEFIQISKMRPIVTKI